MQPLSLALVAFATFVSPQSISFIVNNTDPRIIYSPQVCANNTLPACFGSWWDTMLPSGISVKTSNGPGGSFEACPNFFTFAFTGDGIELHGLEDASGASMLIQLDNTTRTYNSTNPNVTQEPAMFFHQNNLDPNQQHTLTVTWEGYIDGSNYWLYFDHLIVSTPTSSTSTASSSSASVTADQSDASSISTLPSGQTGQSKTKSWPVPTIIVLSLAGVILGGVVIFFTCFFYQTRKRARQRMGPRPIWLEPLKKGSVYSVYSETPPLDLEESREYDTHVSPFILEAPVLPSSAPSPPHPPQQPTPSARVPLPPLLDLEITEPFSIRLSRWAKSLSRISQRTNASGARHNPEAIPPVPPLPAFLKVPLSKTRPASFNFQPSISPSTFPPSYRTYSSSIVDLPLPPGM